MRIRVLYHGRCFDGAASAALLSKFLQDYYFYDGSFQFQGVLHTPGFRWDATAFDGDENAIVDFRYSTHPKLTWWFDHHQSAFLTPQDEIHFQQNPSPHKVLDTGHASCTGLIAAYLKRKFAYEVDDLSELIHWADVIDGARYPTPEAAVDILHPASRLKLVIENAHDPAVQDFVVRKLRYRPMVEILDDPTVKSLERRFVDEQLELVELLMARFERRGRVAVFDLTDTAFERHNKLMPYMMFREIDHAVTILRMGDLLKISIGSNPWSTIRQAPNLATLAERYGGGGHPAVAGISLALDDMAQARRIVVEIVQALGGTSQPAEPINGLPSWHLPV